jgi:DNA-binding GntR family transcriptional regulator
VLLRDNIYAAIRADILACVLRPGAEVREQELAQRYAVSRQPVREAAWR